MPELDAVPVDSHWAVVVAAQDEWNEASSSDGVDSHWAVVVTLQDECNDSPQQAVRLIPWLKATPPEVDNFSLKFDDSFPPPFLEPQLKKEHTPKINPTHSFTLHSPSSQTTTPYFLPYLTLPLFYSHHAWA